MPTDTKPSINEVREFMNQSDCHFICPECGGSFWGTNLVGFSEEHGYCKTPACHFTWPRDNDGEVFYVIAKINDAIRPPPQR